jgi:hypothetical protein
MRKPEVLKGLGFSRANNSFEAVIPSRPEPRLRGEDDEESAFFRHLISCLPMNVLIFVDSRTSLLIGRCDHVRCM